MQDHGRSLSMGLMLVWALPTLVIQWLFGAQALMAHKRRIVGVVGSATAFLTLADRGAISEGTRAVSPRFSLPSKSRSTCRWRRPLSSCSPR